MMIKDILVSVPVGSTSKAAVDYAISMATAFDAHLAGVAFAYEPVVPGTVFNGVAANIIDTYRAESEKAGRAAIAGFEEAVRRAGLPAESHLLESATVGCGEVFAHMARHFDISVVLQTEPESDAPEELLPEAALFGSGRPVLMVPYIHKAGVKLDRVLVCWDGSRAAARAIGDAMPLLMRSKSIDVLSVSKDEGPRDELPGADIAQHLARHKLKVDYKRIVAKDIDVASAILSHAADSGADMAVMGGYGHSRLREFVLGGATRGMLQAMTIPVLMSH
jgi:nucleotide-binding universal stress UspA family protein